MENRVWSITILVFVMSSFLFLPAYSQEQKQFHVTTKPNFPEILTPGETEDFRIQMTYNGPYSWVKGIEPKFEIVPTSAQPYVEIETDEKFSHLTVWKNNINTLQGTIHVAEDSPFDAVFLTVSFDGTIRFDEHATSVDPDSTISLKIGPWKQEIRDGPNFHEGHIEWVSRCYMIGPFPITAKIIDHDMNNDPQSAEELNITVWSDYEDQKEVYVATETGNNTGVFEAEVFFTTTDSSPGKRIRAIDDSTIHAKYVDHTFSDSYKAVDVTDTFVMSGLDILEKDRRGIPSKIAYDSCAHVLLETNQKRFDGLDVFYPAPLKQMKSGLLPDEVMCKEDLQPAYRSSEAHPSCVKPDTASKLIERGWAKISDVGKKHSTSEQPIVTIPQGAVIEGNENLIPKVITVVLGKNNTVTWINQDDTAHGITSNDSSWGSKGVLKPGDSFSVTFNSTGIYEYYGQPHPWQTGIVIVLEKGNDD